MANLQEPRQIAGFASTPGRWKRYPAYKPSGADWLGEIPAHWEVKRLKYVAPICDERAYAVEPEARYIGLEHIESATGRLGESASNGSQNGAATEGTAAVFRTGDVLFGKLRPYLSKVLEASFDGVSSTELLVMRPTPEITSRFLAYTLLSKEFIAWVDSMTYGTKMPRASPEQVTNTEAPLPPVTEQGAIAAFLDRETVKIFALVAKKERLIELLQEKRAALITHAVTKGLNPSALVKPSGVEWLGPIPQHWRVGRLKHHLELLEQGWSPLCENRQAEDDEWGVLKVGCVNGTRFDQAENKALPRGVEPDPSLEIRPGDVLLSRANTRELLGSVSVIHEVRPRLLLCDKLYRLRLSSKGLDPGFLVYQLGTPPVRYQMEREATGASGSMQNIAQDTVRNLLLVRPPRSEQGLIARFSRVEEAALESLIGKIREAIERLREYRAALISAAVTGRIDVRGEVAS